MVISQIYMYVYVFWTYFWYKFNCDACFLIQQTKYGNLSNIHVFWTYFFDMNSMVMPILCINLCLIFSESNLLYESHSNGAYSTQDLLHLNHVRKYWATLEIYLARFSHPTSCLCTWKQQLFYHPFWSYVSALC